MDNLEKVEKVREKTGVGYEEAKQALEASNYDMLDAIIYLEQLGKISYSGISRYSSNGESEPSKEFEIAQQTYEKDCNRTSAQDVFSKFIKWCGRVFRRGCETSFNVEKQGKRILSVPVIVLVLVGFIALPITIILLVVGLFCDCKYYFEGFKNTTVDINELCNKASDTCQSIKNDFNDK